MELTELSRKMLVETGRALKGVERRLFMARTVRSFGIGGQRMAERELGGVASQFARRCMSWRVASGVRTPIVSAGGNVPRNTCRVCSTTSVTLRTAKARRIPRSEANAFTFDGPLAGAGLADFAERPRRQETSQHSHHRPQAEYVGVSVASRGQMQAQKKIRQTDAIFGHWP